MVDMKAFADVVAQAIDVATAPLLARIAVLEKRALMHGRDGRDAVPVDVEAIALKAAALIPRPENGRDGKDASVDLDTLALKAAALVPLPKDGRDAAPVDLDVVALKAAALIPKPVDGRDAPAVDIEAIAVKAAAMIPKPEPGRDGKDAPAVDLDALAVKAAALVPKPLDGKDGKDAPVVEVNVDEVVSHMKALVDQRFATFPTARDGKDGKDVDAAMLEVIVASHVERAVSAIPRPLDGKSLTPEDVAPLIQAEVTKAAAALTSGRDGVGVSGAVIDHAGVLRLTLSDGKSLECGPVRGAPGADVDMDLVRKSISDEVAKIPPPKDGQNGKDGRDGLGFDDLSAFIDDEKGAVLRFKQGDRVEDHVLSWPLYKGPYRAGELYRKLWQVTAQGSLWSAQEDTRDRPGSGSTAWRLVVKRGQDGKDGRDGKDADHG